jgi:hypothetical protein
MQVMGVNSKEAFSDVSSIPESTSSTASDVKTMIERVWAVAELLAEVAHRETDTIRSNRVSEKTQH